MLAFRRLACVALLGAGAAALGAACLSPTQFDVQLSTDLDCARVARVEIFVGPKGAVDRSAPQAVLEQPQCPGGSLGNVVLVPSGARNAPIGVEVLLTTTGGTCTPDASGKVPPTCAVARRALSFVPHAPLRLPIQLDAACLGVTCEDEGGKARTCLRGQCVPAELTDPAVCSDLRDCPTGSPVPDGGSPSDGAPPDVGLDGAGSDVFVPPGAASALSAAVNHTCAVVAGGAVKCWGSGIFSQLGTTPILAQATPTIVSPLAAATQVGAGSQHSCAVVGTNVQCWGTNGGFQLGNMGTASQTPTAPVMLAGPPFQLATGWYHNCVRVMTGPLQCWGLNQTGQLGDNTTSNRAVPVNVNVTGAIAVAAGAGHTCAVTALASAYCWGDNQYGQLGDNSTVQRRVPTLVSSLFSPQAIAAGARHTCATSGGDVLCWGDNTAGQLGTGGGASLEPVQVAGAAPAIAVAAGDYHTCVLLQGGGVKCWGNNTYGQLGTGDTTSRPTPAFVVGLAGPATAIVVGQNHTCARLATGAVQCWGDDQFGQLGDGTAGGTSPAPVAVIGL